jgi:hypothetical protein
MPAGFQLDESTAEIITAEHVARGIVTAHETKFSNATTPPTNPNRVEAAVIVFRNEEAASNAFVQEIAYTEMAPGYVRLPDPAYGQAAAAFGATGVLEGETVETYYVFSYQGNVLVVVLIKGPAGVTEVEDAGPYIQRMLDKLP